MGTEAALKALSNSLLASGTEITAEEHREINDAIIEEVFDAQSRGNVLSGVQSGVLVSGDKVLIIRSGVAYLIDSDDFGFIDKLVDLTDVDISSPLNNQIVVWDSSSSKFVVKNLSDITTGGSINGSGTTNAIPKFTSGTNIGDSAISDNGTTVSTSLLFTVSKNGQAVLLSGSNPFIDWGGNAYAQADSSVFRLQHISNLVVRIASTDVLNVTSSGVTVPTGTVGGYKDTTLGTNATALDAENVRELNVTAAAYTASTTLTFSNVTNLKSVSMRITNTNANTLTFAGITVKFAAGELPSGVSFATNALTFPADSGVDYNIVLFSFDGSEFRGKIELDG